MEREFRSGIGIGKKTPLNCKPCALLESADGRQMAECSGRDIPIPAEGSAPWKFPSVCMLSACRFALLPMRINQVYGVKGNLPPHVDVSLDASTTATRASPHNPVYMECRISDLTQLDGPFEGDEMTPSVCKDDS